VHPLLLVSLIVAYVAIAASIVAGAWVVLALVRGRWTASVSTWAAWVVAAAGIIGGSVVAALATPDWSPWSMMLFYLPFCAVGAWGAGFAILNRRGTSRARASWWALAIALVAVPLSPLLGFVLWSVWPLALPAAGIALYLNRPFARKPADPEVSPESVTPMPPSGGHA